ncbi:hypothetical protein [Pseudoalteromonas rubra]|uniref:Uncharacterized protein n=1 Tax=Pseudoalteromonas rubra TaxID=43658 RepID=A0A0F4QEG8_9GAMM|nr:hypothetical protein [Pseudoalteromonas rubra]KJZ05649.1 hypothetical protein TW77_22315 [Pseudoalteromonas rubra]
MIMKIHAFFNWIWRINGLILFLIVLFLGAMLVYDIGRDLFSEQGEQNVPLNLAEDKDREENWDLGYPEQLGDYDYFLIPLESEKLTVDATAADISTAEGFKRSGSSQQMYSSYRKSRMKNAILINASTNESHWLFDSVDQLIYRFGTLVQEGARLNEQEQAIFYELINKDTNEDQQLDYNDDMTFALSRLDGTNYTEVIVGYSELITTAVNKDGNLLIVYAKEELVFTALIELSTFSVLDKRALPKVGETLKAH